jgi:hypothetical protein
VSTESTLIMDKVLQVRGDKNDGLTLEDIYVTVSLETHEQLQSNPIFNIHVSLFCLFSLQHIVLGQYKNVALSISSIVCYITHSY